MLNFTITEIKIEHFSPTSLANVKSLKTPTTSQIFWKLLCTVGGMAHFNNLFVRQFYNILQTFHLCIINPSNPLLRHLHVCTILVTLFDRAEELEITYK